MEDESSLSSQGLICFWRSALTNDFFSFIERVIGVLKNLNELFVCLLTFTVKSTLIENNSEHPPGLLLFITLKYIYKDIFIT